MPPPASRPPLTRERILEAAVAISDAEGIAALSMRRLAREVGVEAMSLYHHFANKEALLDGLVDAVAGEIALPDAALEWKESMRTRAGSIRHVLLRHPWVAPLFLSRVNVGPNMLRLVDATIGSLRAAGFSLAAADHAWNAIDAYTFGFTIQEQSFPFEPSEYAAAAEAFLPRIPAETYPHLHAMSRAIIDGEHDGRHDFARGLEWLLDGLEREWGSGR